MRAGFSINWEQGGGPRRCSSVRNSGCCPRNVLRKSDFSLQRAKSPKRVTTNPAPDAVWCASMHAYPSSTKTDLKEPSNETNHSHLWTHIRSDFVADDGVDVAVPSQNRNHQRGDCWLYGHHALVHAGVLRNSVLSRECREW